MTFAVVMMDAPESISCSMGISLCQYRTFLLVQFLRTRVERSFDPLTISALAFRQGVMISLMGSWKVICRFHHVFGPTAPQRGSSENDCIMR